MKVGVLKIHYWAFHRFDAYVVAFVATQVDIAAVSPQTRAMKHMSRTRAFITSAPLRDCLILGLRLIKSGKAFQEWGAED
jgi:hypothetical protein